MNHPDGLISKSDFGCKLDDALKSWERISVIPEFCICTPQLEVVSPIVWPFLNRFLVGLDGFVLPACPQIRGRETTIGLVGVGRDFRSTLHLLDSFCELACAEVHSSQGQVH